MDFLMVYRPLVKKLIQQLPQGPLREPSPEGYANVVLCVHVHVCVRKRLCAYRQQMRSKQTHMLGNCENVFS